MFVALFDQRWLAGLGRSYHDGVDRTLVGDSDPLHVSGCPSECGFSSMLMVIGILCTSRLA